MHMIITEDFKIKRIVVTLCLWALVLTSYMSIGHLIPPSGLKEWIMLPIDNMMPYVPGTVFIYSLFFYVPLGLAIWVIKSSEVFYRYSFSILIGALINFSVFIFMPIAFVRHVLNSAGAVLEQVPYEVINLPGDIISPAVMANLYTVDPSTCTFPSTHITYAVCLAYGLFKDKSKWGSWMAFDVLLLILVIMTTKQHYFLDGVVGLMTGLIAGWLAFRIKLRPS